MTTQSVTPGDDELKLLAEILRSGKIEHAPHGGKTGFNLGYCATRAECGTVACIGGWLWLIANPHDVKGAFQYIESNLGDDDDLRVLFAPNADIGNWPDGVSYAQITPAAAADAIDQYLVEGDVDWSEICTNHNI